MKSAFIPRKPPSSRPPVRPARPANHTDIATIAATLRPECRNECLAVTGEEPLLSLTADLERTYVIEASDGLPLASITISPVGKDCVIGVSATTRISGMDTVQRFVQGTAKFCMELHATYDAVHVMLDARNVPMSVLLRDCGFEFNQRFERFGKEQSPFNLYTSKRSCPTPYN